MPARPRCGWWSRACSTLVVLVLALVWLARRTRRYVNVPAGGRRPDRPGDPGRRRPRPGRRRAHVSTRRATASYAATLSTAQARIAGFDAKANESLTLIARGSGAAFEEAWQASDAVVSAELDELATEPGVLVDLEPPAVVRLRSGARGRSERSTTPADWEDAVALATGTGTGTSNATFASFDDDLRATSWPASTGQTATQLDEAGGWLPLAGALGVLAGVRRGALRLVGRLPATGGVPMSRRRRPPHRSSRWRCWPPACWLRRARRPATTSQRRWPRPVGGSVAVDQLRHRRPRRHRPAPTSSTANCLQSYAPPTPLPAPGRCRPAATWARSRTRPADRRGLGRHPAARRPQPDLGPDRGLRHRHAARRSRRPSSATRTRSSCGSSPLPSGCPSSRTAASTSWRAT